MSGLILDPRVRLLDGGRTLLGGDPGRVLRLTERGAGVLRELLAAGDSGAVDGGATQAFARRLIDAGLAHPRPARAPTGAVTVLIPVRDRPAGLERCLAALIGDDVPERVIVVDDGSADASAVAAVCAGHGCELIRRERAGGPGAARNAALARIESGPVALLDSDCVPEPGWLSLLCGALAADPGLGAVAPRVRPLGAGRCGEGLSGSGGQTFPTPGRTRSEGGGGAGALARFAAVRSPLDLGPWPSLVRPGGRVAYVPTAALLVRREALGDTPAAPFDPALRHGEDVDLVWRIIDRGWSVRYAPDAVVWHEEPARVRPWLARRFRYGSSAGPLARRHPGRLAPVALHPRSVVTLAAIAATLGQRTCRPRPPVAARAGAAAAAVAVHAGITVRSLSRHGVPPGAAAALALRGLSDSGAALGRAATMLGSAPLAAALLRPRTRRGAVTLVLASPLRDYVRLRPPLDPLRFAALALADDVAYGAGVWAGALRARTWRPLCPRIVR